MSSTYSDLGFDQATGLVPAVVQDARSGRVLMLGYMDDQALRHTRRSSRVTSSAVAALGSGPKGKAAATGSSWWSYTSTATATPFSCAPYRTV